MNTLITIFDLVWLVAVLILLFLIWRDGVRRRNTTEKTLVDVTTRSTETAKVAAEAAMRLANYLEKRLNGEPPAQ